MAGTAATGTGVGAPVGAPVAVVGSVVALESAAVAVVGVANVAGALNVVQMANQAGDNGGSSPNKTSSGSGSAPPSTEAGSGSSGQGGGEIQKTHNSIRQAPSYPANFKPVQNGTTRNVIKNTELLEQLRSIEPGQWSKVYKDGFVGSDRVSLHYFESQSGRIFNFKVKQGWSNL